MSKENGEHSIFNEALKRLPLKWFEEDYSHILAFATTVIVGFKMWDHVPDADRLYLRMLAAGVYIAGSFLDTESTVRFFDRFNIATEKGIEYPVYEESPLLANATNRAEILKHWRQVFDYAFSGVSVLIPAVGLATGIYRSMAALNNYRQIERVNLAIKISEDRSQE